MSNAPDLSPDDEDIDDLDSNPAVDIDASNLEESNDDEDADDVEDEEPIEEQFESEIFAVRTTANREDQVVGFLSSNVEQEGYDVYSIIRAHGMRGYIFVEAKNRDVAERAIDGIPYAKEVLPRDVKFEEIEHMLEQTKEEADIRKNDIAEVISGPFKRQEAEIQRVDKEKGEVVVELLEAAVPIPITLDMDAVKVIRREE
jgi:transcriptional antiterminator NusG